MLMDEPFGAVDPVVRDRLQREFSELLRRLGKTVVMVTHDINEAVRMGDRVAVMREGRIIQYDTPDRLLAAPGDALVTEFVGSDRALKRLSLVKASLLSMAAAPSDAPVISSEDTLLTALSVMLPQARARRPSLTGTGTASGASRSGDPRPCGCRSARGGAGDQFTVVAAVHGRETSKPEGGEERMARRESDERRLEPTHDPRLHE
jgi:ABC-type proline/glycine betaine transport system ATPase subunit